MIPRQVRIFLAFSVAASVFELLSFVPALEWLKEITVPFTGWVGAMPYIFTLGAWPSLFKRPGHPIDPKALRWYLTTACLVLAIGAAFGIVDFLVFGNLRNETSPWLRYSPWRPLWTVCVPLAWCVVLWNQRARIRGKLAAAGSGLQGAGLARSPESEA